MKPFECTVCGKRFTTSGHLVRYSRMHSGEKLYKCCMCNKAFSRPGHLHRHMRVHTGDKPYCSLCDKSFRYSSHLPQHKHCIHSNKRPYHCHYCGKLFVFKHELLLSFYSARNARIASAVLATAIPSVRLSVCLSVCLSVTRRYCVKTTARSTVQFAPLDSKMCLVL